jgi:aspartyl protease family protein
MRISSGTKGLLSDVLGWAVAACILALSMAHFDALKSTAAALLGLPSPAQLAAMSDPKPALAAQSSSGGYELRAGANGHFITAAEVNGQSVEVMVDTGASFVALTYEDAERAGIFLSDADFKHRANTANGVARIAAVTIDRLSIGPITVRDVQAAVSERGRLQTSLLGMSFLGRLSKFEMRPGALLLHE